MWRKGAYCQYFGVKSMALTKTMTFRAYIEANGDLPLWSHNCSRLFVTSFSIAPQSQVHRNDAQTSIPSDGMNGVVRDSATASVSRFAAILSPDGAPDSVQSGTQKLDMTKPDSPSSLRLGMMLNLVTSTVYSRSSVGIGSGDKQSLDESSSHATAKKQKRTQTSASVLFAVPVDVNNNDGQLNSRIDPSVFQALNERNTQNTVKVTSPNPENAEADLLSSVQESTRDKADGSTSGALGNRRSTAPSVANPPLEFEGAVDASSPIKDCKDPIYLSFQLKLFAPVALAASTAANPGSATTPDASASPTQMRLAGNLKGAECLTEVLVAAAPASRSTLLSLPELQAVSSDMTRRMAAIIAPVDTARVSKRSGAAVEGQAMSEASTPIPRSVSAAGPLETLVEGRAQVIQRSSGARPPVEGDLANSPLLAPGHVWKREHVNATLCSADTGSEQRTGPVAVVTDTVKSQASNQTVHSANLQLSSGRALATPDLSQPLPPKAASQIAIRLEAAGESGQVELRIRERGGEVQIDVRSSDLGIATNLKQNLGDLVKRLDLKGFGSDLIHQDTDLVKQPVEHVQHVPGDDSSRGYSSFSDNSRQHQQNQGSRQDNQPDVSDDALEELRNIFNDFNKGVLLS